MVKMIKNKEEILLKVQSIKNQLEYSHKYLSVIETKISVDFSINQIIEAIEVEISRLTEQVTEFKKIVNDWKSNLPYQKRAE